MPRGRWLLVLSLLACATPVACDGCDKKQQPAPRNKDLPRQECATAADCSNDDPCTESDCREARCVALFLAAGTSCENDTVCDGVSTCDGKGKCTASAPPSVDDGNACTRDFCDATRGALHEQVAVDDRDACTRDACDPRTGEITHDPVDIDDGDDCTRDSCDRSTGPKHETPEPDYKCGSCAEGFHTASRRPNRQCGGEATLQSFCVPDCGSSFYSCDASCPAGFEEKSRAPNRQCGLPGTPMLFCKRASH